MELPKSILTMCPVGDLTKPCTACSKARRSCTEVSRYQFRYGRKRDLSHCKPKQKICRPALGYEKHQIRFDADNAKHQSIIRKTDGKDLGYPSHRKQYSPGSNRDIVLNTSWTSPERSASPKIHILGEGTASIPLSRQTGELWPLSTKDEAFLMRYFVTELSLWVCLHSKRFAGGSSFDIYSQA